MRSIKMFMLVGVLFGILLVSCKDAPRSTQLSYSETQCSDPWDHGNDSTEHIANIQNYLAAHGVNATNVQFEYAHPGMIVCSACTCPAGIKVYISVGDDDIAEANSVGFH
jgi:hypothetical protein